MKIDEVFCNTFKALRHKLEQKATADQKRRKIDLVDFLEESGHLQ